MTQCLGRAPLLIGDPARPVKRVAWCTGAAQSLFENALNLDVDVFLTGEISEQHVHLARESGVAFLACGHSHKASEAVAFLICDTCGTVAETTSAPMRRSLDAVAEEVGFSPRSRVIEVTGTCATCRAA